MLLTPKQAAAITLRKKHGLTDAEIAERMDIRRDNANKLIARGLRKIKEIKKECIANGGCGLLENLA